MDRYDVVDWRRRVGELYAAIRRTADPADGHALWRTGRAHLMREHPASPVTASRQDYPGPEVAGYDPAYRFVVPVRDTPADRRTVVLAEDGEVVMDRIGRVELPGLGGLDVWWLAGYGGGLFVPVADSSPDTYGGGRYLLDTIKGADLGGSREALLVDLNFAYQPSCAYDDAWVCPLPGPGNQLDLPVPVGERYR